jgi:hypothetical protein
MTPPMFFNPYIFGGGTVGGWVELGRTTLGGTGDNIAVTSLADKRYLMYLTYTGAGSGNITTQMRLNSDTGSNYSYRISDSGGADATGTSQTIMASGVGGGSASTPIFDVGYLANVSTKEKLLLGHGVGGAIGATAAPIRREFVGKHAQTTNPISAVTQFNPESGDFASGAELVVLGWDPDDTHTNNFWEELASETTTAATSVTATISEKKYLWVQFYSKGFATNDRAHFRMGDGSVDSGTNYAYRVSTNGGTDSTGGSGDRILSDVNSAHTTPDFFNLFIINNSANEKLVIGHHVGQSTAGAATAPVRNEFVGKHVQTSGINDTISFVAESGNNFTAGGILKVWGAD